MEDFSLTRKTQIMYATSMKDLSELFEYRFIAYGRFINVQNSLRIKAENLAVVIVVLTLFV